MQLTSLCINSMKNIILFSLITVLVSIGGISNIDAAEIGDVISPIEINSLTPNGPDLDTRDYFGTSVANIGDINNDGINDIAVGATGDDNYKGAVYVILLNSDGTPKSTIKINNSTTNGPDLSDSDAFGRSIANIGDINGDGINDIAVGAWGDDTGGSNAGAVHIITLNSTGYPIDTFEINDTTTNGPNLSNGDRFGSSIANIGDRDNNGIDDIAIGARGDDAAGGSAAGAIHIITLNSDGSVQRTIKIDDTTTNGPALFPNDYFGSSIANIGDINDDGTNDIAVGAYGDDAGGSAQGTVHIITFNSNGYPISTFEINDTTTNGPDLDTSDYFGSSIVNIGDLNKDGIDDIAVGAWGDDTGGSSAGTVHIITLNSDGTPKKTVEINSITANGPVLSSGDEFGTSVANIGDINGDGIEDIVVGATYDDAGSYAAGTVHIITLNSDGTPKSTVENYQDQINSLNTTITQLNNTLTTLESSIMPEYYLVEGDKKDMPGGSGAMRATVSCDAGDIAVSGGYYLGGITEGYRSIRIMDFHQTDNGEGWFMRMDNISNKFAEVYPSVMCAHYPN